MAEFKDLQGKVISKIVGKIGDEEMLFETTERERYILYYEHD
jgi:hypothetical protein